MGIIYLELNVYPAQNIARDVPIQIHAFNVRMVIFGLSLSQNASRINASLDNILSLNRGKIFLFYFLINLVFACHVKINVFHVFQQIHVQNA